MKFNIRTTKIGIMFFIGYLLLSINIGMVWSQNHRPNHQQISITDFPDKKEVEIKFGEQLFSKYIYHDDIEKPVLYPIYTSTGKMVTRGYPLIPLAGERSDHPHHLGLWFNYGDVNGLDFWNNSSAIPEGRKEYYGEIRHRRITVIDSKGDHGTLEIEANWNNSKMETLLTETTRFEFSKTGHTIIVDRITTLTAQQEVLFQDNKEGMIGIRVTRALELPADKPEIFTDALGNPTEVKVLNNEGVTGEYLSSSGKTGNDVWGTRGEWVRLSGQIEGSQVAVAIIDHPENPGYPTYWHARGYGLFAANTLGQNAFDKNQHLNFHLSKGQSATFRYRILIHDNSILTEDDITRFRASFIN